MLAASYPARTFPSLLWSGYHLQQAMRRKEQIKLLALDLIHVVPRIMLMLIRFPCICPITFTPTITCYQGQSVKVHALSQLTSQL